MFPSRRHALLTLAASATLAAAPLPLRAAPRAATLRLVATEFPPYTSAALPEGGIASAITRAALDRSGLAMELHFRPWVRALSELQQGVWDGIIGAWKNPERERFMAYPRSLGITNKIGFMARAGSKLAVHDLGRLAGLKIGTVRDYANPPAFEAARLDRDEAVDDLSNLRKLLAGRVDLALIDKGVAHHLLQTELREAAQALVWLEPPVAEMPLYTALSRRKPAHQAQLVAFDRGLVELQTSGELSRILQRHARWY
jgi:polar amino acid transport system substrate-binding protein